MDDTPTNFPLNKSKDRLDRITQSSLFDEYIHHRFKADAGKQWIIQGNKWGNSALGKHLVLKNIKQDFLNFRKHIFRIQIDKKNQKLENECKKHS